MSGYLSHSKAELDWAADPVPDGMPDGTAKLLLNLVALAAEALPRVGTVGISMQRSSAGFELEVKAVGADAGLRQEAEAALSDDIAIEELTPRNVHGHFTQLLAKQA